MCPWVRLALSALSPHSEGKFAPLGSLLVYESKTPSWNIWRVGKSVDTGKKSLQLDSLPALSLGRCCLRLGVVTSFYTPSLGAMSLALGS